MRVVVVGAGICGLVAGRRLVEAGADVVLVDKGRSPGGRLATRRIGTATVDHGAQFFTVRTPAFRRQVDDWVERGLVGVWSHGFTSDDGHPRYVAMSGMNSLAKDLAVGLDVRCSTMAFGIRPAASDSGAAWEVAIDDGTAHEADAVIVTTPLPQAFALLADSGIHLDQGLMRTEYDRTIALLVTLDRAPAIADPGGLQGPAPELSFISDNVAKGVSDTPAITVHASAAWSEAHWDDDADMLRTALIDLIGPWLGHATVIEAQVKKWRFATPRTSWPEPCWIANGGAVVLAGDAFDGPRVEAAHNSGLAAAHAIVS
ncbi:MAG TPA: FAD-dependent oxidoreductase [Ilumatobacteraceae bacterium]|nr:FAD-dependent oxidoreductase [Ilumatobacteraceae bacterium]